MTTVLSIRNLCTRFSTDRGTALAVDDVSFDVETGRFFSILGPSGCGKTTLLRMIAGLSEPDSGRIMEVYTTEPGVQLYTANGMRDVRGKAGKVYQNHYGFCLETQHFPDSPNKPHFPSTVLRPSEKYDTSTIFKFSTK